MGENDPLPMATVVYLLVRYPPVQSGRDVVGGWELEAWHGGNCAWAVELAGLGAYYWVDEGLAQIVADRALRAQRVPVQSWLPCGSDHAPMYLARLPAGAPGPRRPIVNGRPTGHHRTDHATPRRDRRGTRELTAMDPSPTDPKSRTVTDLDALPGSPAAVASGCRCSVLANASYRVGATSAPLPDPACDLHRSTQPRSSAPHLSTNHAGSDRRCDRR